MSETLNQRQRIIIKADIELTSIKEPALIFINGPGGCGKMYLLNTIIHYLKAMSLPVVTIASLGVAIRMLIEAMTAHSQFKILLILDSTSQCSWKTRARSTQSLQESQVIIWYKISMQSKYAVEVVNQVFKDLMKNDSPFGGKVVIFGGDFQQTLPLVLGGSIFDQAEVCMINSYLWSDI
jgi:hypothetical protein